MPRTERPWKVFVRDIGPTFSFANEAAARERAQALIASEILIGRRLHGPYCQVEVTGPCPRQVTGWERTVYRYDRDPWIERWDGGWHRVGRLDSSKETC